jgi:hypothetical protein
MSLGHGASIVTSGLVLYYDISNIQKSWRGAPATNLLTETNLNNWTKTADVSASIFATPFDTPAYVITDDNTGSYESISRAVTIPADGSSYTLSCMIRKTYGGTSARLGFNISMTGGTAVNLTPRINSDTGVAAGGTVIDYGDWWYWHFTSTNNSSNTSLSVNFYPATGVHNGSDTTTATGTAIVGAIMLVTGSTAVRFADGTRSNTQTVLDLAGSNIFTATSLTYSSNNTFSFNGTSDYIQSSIPVISVGSSASIEAIVRFSSNVTNLQTIYSHGASGTSFAMGMVVTSSNLRFRNTTGDHAFTSPTTLNVGQWYHLVISVSSTQTTGYVNGISQGTSNQVISSNSITDFSIGRRAVNGASEYLGGDIASVKVYYNKQLTEAEVQQNFNAFRGRYGI